MSLDRKPTAISLKKDLKYVAHKWNIIGVHMKIPKGELDGIDANVNNAQNTSVDYRFHAVICAWLNGPTEKITVEVLAEAVRMASHGNLARELLKEGFNTFEEEAVTTKLQNCKARYNTLGLHLDVSSDFIRGLEIIRGDCVESLNRMLDYYFNNMDVNMRDICKAMKIIGRTDLSDLLSKQYEVPKDLPEPKLQLYDVEIDVDTLPQTEAENAEMDFENSKITFKRYKPLSKDDQLKEVKMNYGIVKPQKGEKNPGVAGAYNMSKWPHGICIIINNEKILGCEPRKGTNVDEYNLVQTFRHLGYIVEVHRDCVKSKIIQIFKAVQRRGHVAYDSFVCCIMSHGHAGHIIGSDRKSVPLKVITDMFKGDKCDSLNKKPKLFFLQACRVEQKKNGVPVAKDGCEDEATLMAANSVEPVVSDSVDETVSSAADFLFSYATPMGHVAYRNEASGSWFMSELCTSLTSYGTYANLLDMLTRTNEEVAKHYTLEGSKQAPDHNTLLRKGVFFF